MTKNICKQEEHKWELFGWGDLAHCIYCDTVEPSEIYNDDEEEMEIDYLGDGEWIETEVYTPEHATDYEKTKITIKPTKKLLELLEFLQELKTQSDKQNEYYKYNLLRDMQKQIKEYKDKKNE